MKLRVSYHKSLMICPVRLFYKENLMFEGLQKISFYPTTQKIQEDASKMNQVLVVHCQTPSSHTTSSLAKNLLNIELPHDHQGNYTHAIHTKYYTAQLEFSTVLDKTNIHNHGSELNPHALIVTFENNEEAIGHVQSTIQQVRSFYTNAEVCLCVNLTKKKNDNDDSQHAQKHRKLIEICIDEQFELVQQPTENDDEEEEEEDEYEKYGHERVIEALQSTMWPNMEKPVPVTPSATQQKKQTKRLSETVEAVIEEDTQSKEIADLLHEVLNAPSTATTDEEKEVERFDELLGAMLTLRQSGHTLSDNDRKKRAADLALSLFSMIGGEEEDEL
jgi:hypothetical protein